MNCNLAQFLNVVGDAVVIADVSGTITAWNPAAERLFGYTESEALSRSLDIIIPARLRARHWSGYHQTMKTGETKYGTSLLRVPAVRRDGSSLSVAFTVAIVAGNDGRPDSVIAVLRDDTSRFNTERELRKRLAEAEARVPA